MTYPTHILALADLTVPSWLSQTSAASLLVVFGYFAIKYFVRREDRQEQTISDLHLQLMTAQEARRQDSLKTLEVLSDVTQVIKDTAGNQLGLEGSVGQLSKDITNQFTRLEGVVREVR